MLEYSSYNCLRMRRLFPFSNCIRMRRQSPLSNCVRTRTQFRLFLIESLCQKSLARRSRLYFFIETIGKTNMRLGISVKKRNISIYGVTSTCAIHQPKALLYDDEKNLQIGNCLSLAP